VADVSPDQKDERDILIKASAPTDDATVTSTNIGGVAARETRKMGLEIASPNQTAQALGYTGESCSNCNSMRVKRNGSCTVCEDCGSTTGCS
jgi:ribonucleoside-diphosphate reductase alpha chain